MTTRPFISQLCPTFLIFCHVQPCVLYPAAHQADILHMCLLASRLGTLSHPEYSGPPPHQPSLVNSYCPLRPNLKATSPGKLSLTPLSQAASPSSVLTEPPARAAFLWLLTPVPPYLSLCVFDKAGIFLGTGATSLSLHLSHLRWCLFQWKPSFTVC